MPSSGGTAIRRWVGFVAATSALVLVLLGGMSAPVAAQTRRQAVKQANAFIDECFKNGGEPDTGVGPKGDIAVSCTYENGGRSACTWVPTNGYKQDCFLVAGTTTHPPTGGGTLDGAQAVTTEGLPSHQRDSRSQRHPHHPRTGTKP